MPFFGSGVILLGLLSFKLRRSFPARMRVDCKSLCFWSSVRGFQVCSYVPFSLSLSLSLSLSVFFFTCLFCVSIEDDDDVLEVAPFPAAWLGFIAVIAVGVAWLFVLDRGPGTCQRRLALLRSCLSFAFGVGCLSWTEDPAPGNAAWLFLVPGFSLASGVFALFPFSGRQPGRLRLLPTWRLGMVSVRLFLQCLCVSSCASLAFVLGRVALGWGWALGQRVPQP